MLIEACLIIGGFLIFDHKHKKKNGEESDITNSTISNIDGKYQEFVQGKLDLLFHDTLDRHLQSLSQATGDPVHITDNAKAHRKIASNSSRLDLYLNYLGVTRYKFTRIES